MPFTYINKTDRTKLVEGRNFGIAHGFCKRDGDTLTAINPPSACKDYLNDIVYSEATGKPWEVYGLKTTKVGAFDDGFGYLTAQIVGLGAKTNSPYSKQKQDEAQLKSNWPNMLKAVNLLEERLQVEGRTKMEWIAENTVLAILPKQWIMYYYMISMFALVQRSCLYWDGEEDLWKFLANVQIDDRYALNSCLKAIAKLEKYKGKLPVEDVGAVSQPHSMGINWFNTYNLPETHPKTKKITNDTSDETF